MKTGSGVGWVGVELAGGEGTNETLTVLGSSAILRVTEPVEERMWPELLHQGTHVEGMTWKGDCTWHHCRRAVLTSVDVEMAEAT